MRDWLKNLREDKKMSTYSAAEAIGVSQSYYFAIEQGDRQKKMDIVLATKISSAFGVSVGKIIKLENDSRAAAEAAEG